jgi:hypothetical protein
MEKDKDKTIVVFRKYSDGEIIALFPEIPADYHGALCDSYMHVGQHGSASCSDVSQNTKLASPAEYASLKRELEGIGYNLSVRERITPSMRATRMRAPRRGP